MADRGKMLWGLALITVFATITVGAVVRAMGAGMGCGPDWPTCNGEIIPGNLGETDVLLEYTHRLVALLSAIAVVAASVYSMRRPGVPRGLRALYLAAPFLILGQSLVGMLVVRFHLHPAYSSLHLILASGLLVVTVYAFSRKGV